MRLPVAGTAAITNPELDPRPETTTSIRPPMMISKRWLRMVRVLWLTIASFGVGLFVASIPAIYERQLQIITNPILQENMRDLGLAADVYALLQTGFQVGFGTVCCTVAGIIFWRKSDEVMPLFVALLLIAFGAAPTTTWLETLPPTWAAPASALRFFGFASAASFFFVFPNGHFVPRWTGWLALYWPCLLLLVILFPEPPDALRPFFVVLYLASLPGLLGSFAFAQIYRYRRVSTPAERQQTKWLVFAVTSVAALALAGSLLGLLLPDIVQPGTLWYIAGSILMQAAMLLIPVSLGIAILRYRLWDVDTIITRTLVYASLTAGIGAIYVLIVTGVGTLFAQREPAGGQLAVSLLAAGCVAVLFQPLREQLHRQVNRLMYGERDEPYTAISRLGQRLAATLAPEAVLPTIVETVREALKLPYAAIALVSNTAQPPAEANSENDRAMAEPDTIVAISGSAVPDLLRVPLIYQGARRVLAPGSTRRGGTVECS